jgi:hypothetical protein
MSLETLVVTAVTAAVKVLSDVIESRDARDRAKAWRALEAEAKHRAAIEDSRALHEQERRRRGH